MKLGTRKVLFAAVAIGMTMARPALADTTLYSFSGLYNIAGGSQRYTGVFTVDNPVLTTERPPQAPDMTQPNMAAVWAGTSQFYTGGINVRITFASGTQIAASRFGIVVNNTTFSGSGAPYPLGLSVQLYPEPITLTGPTGDICATPTGECGPDDDPLYHDDTQAAIMATTGIYFAFYTAPLATAPGMPNLTTSFALGNGGLGVHSVQNGLNTTALTSFDAFSAVTTPVPDAASWLTLGLGLLGVAGHTRRARRNRAAAVSFSATPARSRCGA